MPTPIYPPVSITGSRYDSKSKTGVESKPIPEGTTKYTYWDTKELYDLAAAVRAGQALGGPSVSPESLVNRMLVEGRSDAGTNQYDTDNKAADKLFKELFSSGATEKGATFVAALVANAARAKKKGISEDESWNGTGTSKYGKTGKDYAARIAQSKPAVAAPENAKLLDYVTRALSGNLTKAEMLTQVLPGVEFDRVNASGDLAKLYDKLAWSHDSKDPQQKAVMDALSSLSTLPINKFNSINASRDAAAQATLQSYRRDQGVASKQYPIGMDATSKTIADILSTNSTFQSMLSALGGTP